jgi:hypothetical protein
MNVTTESNTDSKEAAAGTLADLAPDKDKKVATPESQEVSSEADDSDTDVEDTAATDGGEDKPKKKKGGFQRKIGRLEGELAARDREIERLRAETVQKADPTPRAEDKEPNKDDFEAHDDYVRALVKWEAKQTSKAESEQKKASELRARHKEELNAFVQRVDKFTKDHPDFHEALEEVNDIVLQSEVNDYFREADNGPELMYQLAQNRDVLEKISKASSPRRALIELGLFESSLGTKSRSKEVKTSNAPPPIKAVSGAGKGGTASIYDKNISSQITRIFAKSKCPSGRRHGDGNRELNFFKEFQKCLTVF